MLHEEVGLKSWNPRISTHSLRFLHQGPIAHKFFSSCAAKSLPIQTAKYNHEQS